MSTKHFQWGENLYTENKLPGLKTLSPIHRQRTKLIPTTKIETHADDRGGRRSKLSTACAGAGAGRSPTGVGAADPYDGAREQHLVAERQYGEPARQLHRRVRHVGQAVGHANRVDAEVGNREGRRTSVRQSRIKKREEKLESKRRREVEDGDDIYVQAGGVEVEVVCFASAGSGPGRRAGTEFSG